MYRYAKGVGHLKPEGWDPVAKKAAAREVEKLAAAAAAATTAAGGELVKDDYDKLTRELGLEARGQVGLVPLFTSFSPALGLWVGTFHVIQSRTRVTGWHFSRYFAVRTPVDVDDSSYSPCNRSDTRE